MRRTLRSLDRFTPLSALGLCLLLAGCPNAAPTTTPTGTTGGNPTTASGDPVYRILDTRTNGDPQMARSVSEDALSANPDIDAMVGLFEYNPPAILEALRSADKLGDIQVIGFDENQATLQAIRDGNCAGTVVQDPYMYGYRSVEMLAALAAGDRSVLPSDGFVNIPAQKITKDNVDEFAANLAERLSGGTSPNPEVEGRPTVAFVTNAVADFWTIAAAGAYAAGRDKNVNVIVQMPAGGQISEQRRILEDLLAREVDGIAVSPIDPDGEQDILNRIAESIPLLTQDSDAPNSNRLAYVGVSNYDAGVLCGELVMEALPEGGDIMIFVGNLDQNNAKLRRQGLIDHLLGREKDETRYDEPGTVLSSAD